MSGDLSALAATLIGPGGVSDLYDGATGALSAWSNANQTYYSETPAVRAPRRGIARRASAPHRRDPLAALASLAGALHDVQSATIQLVGHSVVNGHPATDLDVQMKRQLPGKPLENYHAQLALADDLNDFPRADRAAERRRRPDRARRHAEARPHHRAGDDPDDSDVRDARGLHARHLAGRRPAPVAAPRVTARPAARRSPDRRPGHGSAVPAVCAMRPPSGGRSSKYQRIERRSHIGTRSSSA